jgi:hypothetical protein
MQDVEIKRERAYSDTDLTFLNDIKLQDEIHNEEREQNK